MVKDILLCQPYQVKDLEAYHLRITTSLPLFLLILSFLPPTDASSLYRTLMPVSFPTHFPVQTTPIPSHKFLESIHLTGFICGYWVLEFCYSKYDRKEVRIVWKLKTSSSHTKSNDFVFLTWCPGAHCTILYKRSMRSRS